MSKGTSQTDKRLTALSTQHFKVDERSMTSLYEEVQHMAKAIRFYESSGKESTQDWSPFFRDAQRYFKIMLQSKDQAESLQGGQDCPPHLALLIAFIKLYGYTQEKLNDLTSWHLDFFYTKVLGEKKKRAVPDSVYVFVELARNIGQYLLPKGEKLLAGKDLQGENVIYTTDHEISLNHTTITQLKALHHSSQEDSSIYSFPVVNSADGYGKALEQGQGWFPFGDVRKTAKISAEIGFGLMSPMLLLKEGKRRITIEFMLDFDKRKLPDAIVTSDHLVVQITSAKQWLTKNVKDFSHDRKKINLVVELDEVDPPVVPYDKAIHGYSMNPSKWPMLKVVFMPGYTFSHYVSLQSVRFSNITLTTEVEGATSLVVKNDYGELDVNKAFHPLGFTPVRGSNFFVGIPETYTKPLQKTVLRLTWKGLPENLKIYYEGYLGPTNSLVREKEDYKVRASVRFQKKWLDLPNPDDPSGEYSLFDESITLHFAGNRDAKHEDPNNENGLIRLTLSSPLNAFGHTLYPAVYAKAIITQLQNKDAPIPNEPYTPVVEYIEASYTSTETMNVGQGDNGSFQYFHLKPFGLERVDDDHKAAKSLPLISDEFHQGGSLYIGFQNFSPPQQLSLFFEVKEVTLAEKPNPGYFYLSHSSWKPLTGNQILTDTTRGLKQTGMLVLNLPEDLSSRNPSMPTGNFWIMVGVKNSAESFDQIMNIRTNGVSCTLLLKDPDELEKITVLPPLSISAPLKKIKEIKKIEQPYSSFGGRATETEDAYFLRVSERLRHKMRGISAWDLERIILGQFPEIYKVKCIQHNDANGNVQPGSVHVIVIPYINPYNKTKILKPFVTSSLLRSIHEHIQKLTSPHVKFEISNPDYEEIKVVAKINFNSQVDAGYYIKKMQTDLQYFLSPWAFRKTDDIQLGSSLYKSSIIEFIESRPYVNFISTIQVLTNDKEVEGQLITLNEKTIMISSETHDIEAIGPDGAKCQTNQGIEEMIVDINFEVQ
jgi:hypothetical protein